MSLSAIVETPLDSCEFTVFKWAERLAQPEAQEHPVVYV